MTQPLKEENRIVQPQEGRLGRDCTRRSSPAVPRHMIYHRPKTSKRWVSRFSRSRLALVDKRVRHPRVGRYFGFLRKVRGNSLNERMGICDPGVSKIAFPARPPQNQDRNSELAAMDREREVGSQAHACKFGRYAASLRQETT